MSVKLQIEYLDDIHMYLVDGIIVPSVSKLVEFVCGGSYANISPSVLEKAAEYGTQVHEAIERYEQEKTLTEGFENQINEYIELKTKYMLFVKNMEKIVAYKKHFCGRYDILDEGGYIWDIKTTSKLYTDKLSWQISFYELAKYGKVKNKVGYAIWLPKTRKHGQVKLIDLHTTQECLEVIEMYEKKQTTEQL